MSRIVIAGAGDFGREVASWLETDDGYRGQDEVVFIDDNPDSLAAHPRLATRLIGSMQDYVCELNDRVLMGVSGPAAKRRIAGLLESRGVVFSTFIHRSAIRALSATVGEGSVICPNAVISSDARIGRFVTANVFSSIGHDASVGDYASLMSHVDVTGWVNVGEDCFLGSHASVLPRVVVEAEATVGAGSVVIRRVVRGSTVVGVPARRL